MDNRPSSPSIVHRPSSVVCGPLTDPPIPLIQSPPPKRLYPFSRSNGPVVQGRLRLNSQAQMPGGGKGGLCGAGTGRSPVPAPHNPPFPFACSFPANGPVLYPTRGGPASTRCVSDPAKRIQSPPPKRLYPFPGNEKVGKERRLVGAVAGRSPATAPTRRFFLPAFSFPKGERAP